MLNQPITCPPIELNSKGEVILMKQKEISFGKKFHQEFKGHIIEEGNGVWIPIIESREIGKGNFSKLINEFKQKYTFIKIPTPSKMMIKIALHLGFEFKREYFGSPYDDWGEILLWKSPTSQTSPNGDFSKEKEHNMGLEASAQEPTPKLSPTEITFLNPNIKRNFGFCSKVVK